MKTLAIAARRMGALLLIVFPASCASTGPTPQLVDARTAYAEAQASNAPSLAPKEVRDAEILLDKAERAHRHKPGSALEMHLAYLAARQAQLALAEAQREEAQKVVVVNQRAYARLRGRVARLTQEQLDSVGAELKQLRAQIVTALNQQKVENEIASLKDRERMLTEREGILEQRIAGLGHKKVRKFPSASQRLEGIAEVGEQGRQIVISLSGPGLFAPGQTELLPSGQFRLQRVAQLLKGQDSGPILILGRNIGGASTILARHRAQAVRQFFVAQGIPKDRIQAFGPNEAEIPAIQNSKGVVNIVMMKPKGGAM